MSTTKQPACGNRIPVYPVRYTVKGKGKKDSSFSYPIKKKKNRNKDHLIANYLDLSTEYPILEYSQYILRILRSGFIYAYDRGELFLWKSNADGTFTDLQGANTIENALQKYKTGDTASHIWVKKNSSQVFMAFTDVLWTKKIYDKVMSDEGFRKKLMVEINVSAWTEDMPTKGTFRIDDIDKLVEEYKNPNWLDELKWSEPMTYPLIKEVSLLKSTMLAIKTTKNCSTKPPIQFAVALHDNIGLVEDQKKLITDARNKIQAYIDEYSREKTVSDIILKLYKYDFAQSKNIEMDKVDKAIEIEVAEWKNNNKESTETTDSITSKVLIKSGLFENRAELIKRNIDEEARLDFVNKYNMKLEELEKTLANRKNDRCSLLLKYQDTLRLTDLGSSFLHYDSDNAVSGGAQCYAFATCIESMMSDPSHIAKIKNKEHDIFDKWWRKNKNDNPILINLRLDIVFQKLAELSGPKQIGGQEQKLDTFAAIFIDAPVAMGTAIADRKRKAKKEWGRQEKLKNEEKIDSYLKEINEKKHEKKQIVNKKRLNDRININSPSRQLLHNMAAYALRHWDTEFSLKNINPKNDNAIVDLIRKMLNMRDIKSAQMLVDMLKVHHEFVYSESVSQSKVVFKTIRGEKYISHFLEASGVKKSPVFDNAIAKLDNQLVVLEENLDKATKQQKKAGEALNLRQNPFLSFANTSFSSLTFILNLVNFRLAVDAICKEFKGENLVNLAGAIFGVAAALHNGLAAFRTSIGEKRFMKVSAQMGLKKATEKVVAQSFGVLFGYLAAVTDGILQGLKSIREFNRGNQEAGAYYLAAGLLIMVGGIYLLKSGAVAVAITGAAAGTAVTIATVGLILIGVLLVGAGLVYLFRGDNAVFTELDNWLNACVFGRREKHLAQFDRYPRIGDDDNKYTKYTAQQEYNDYLSIVYQPTIEGVQREKSTWNDDKDVVTISVSQANKEISKKIALVKGKTLPDMKKGNFSIPISMFPSKSERTAMFIWEGEGSIPLSELSITNQRMDKNGYYYDIEFEIEDNVKYISGCLSYVPFDVSDDEERLWSQRCFLLSGTDVKHKSTKIYPTKKVKK